MHVSHPFAGAKAQSFEFRRRQHAFESAVIETRELCTNVIITGVGHLQQETMSSRNREEPLEVPGRIRTAANVQEVDELNQETRLTGACPAHRRNELAQSRHETIITDAKQRTARYISDPCSFYDQRTGLSLREALVPGEYAIAHE